MTLREKIWAVVKWLGWALKKAFVPTFFIWMAFSIISLHAELKASLETIEEQNTQIYDVQADVYSKLVVAVNAISDYTLAATDASEKRDMILAEFLKNLDKKIKDAENKVKKTEELSLKRDSVIINIVKNIEQKPSYAYMKSRIVYLVEQYGNSQMVSVGTGTVIKVANNETFILTNKHVCDFAEGSVCYVYQDKVKYKISLVKANPVQHDLQVVKTSRVVPNKVAVKGVKDSSPQDKVYVVGHNHGNPFMYSEGTVAGYMRGTNDLLIGMPSGPGNSGSGVFTSDGYLTALLYAGQIFQEDFGNTLDTSHAICVNSKILRMFLSDYFSN